MLATLLLSWIAPLANCDGGLLSLDHYEVWTARIVSGSHTESVISTTDVSLNIPDPAVDEAIAWRDPISVDFAGNTSDECQ